ncbi:G-associated signal transduction [Cryptosporidium sp. chipmunk genotype I]|uniref:G-associated signal transduction n=1 Tax=Cryptosporidium sp. chipmunk genotype I TaxID=1280935 RepID=UPI00351A46B1|nr:G-associated signal transduction [Cryptosporidium sp. chipmunk genotype I]
MKFSKKLQHYVNQQYSQHYLSYKDLKKAIKLITGLDTSSYTINEVTNNFGNIKALAGSIYRPAESRFMDLLNHELDKINSFSSIMYTDIKDSLKQIQGYIDQISKDLGVINNCSNNNNVNDSDSSFFQSGMSKELLDDLISPLVEQLERRSGEIVFLESYQQLNYTGFRKITKKYDKMNKSTSSSWYLARLARESFMNMNLDLLLESLSNCYSRIEMLKSIFLMKEESLNCDKTLENDISMHPPFEIHSKHLILAEDVMKVKVLLTKIVPLVSIGLLNVEDNINNKPCLSSPTNNNTNSQKTTPSENISSLALQTSTVSYMYFDNREFSEYHRIREIRSRFSCSSQINTQIEENSFGRIQAYSDEKIVPKKYLDYTFRLRWYGENEGSPDQWLNLDWIHPMEPSCSTTEWHDPNNKNFVHQATNSNQMNQGVGEGGRTFSFEGSKALVSSKTLLIQQKDVFHILKTYGDLRRESKNPSLSSNFDLNTYLNETRINLSQDQIMLLNCFIDFIQFRKLGPFSHLWFHRTTFANPRRNICIHIDNNLKIMPEIDSELLNNEHLQGNCSSINNLSAENCRKLSSETSRSNCEISNTELGTNSIFNMRPSILYNTYIVSPQTEALVSENMKIVSHGILSISVSQDSGNLSSSNKTISSNSNPREILKDILGLASVSEVIGFSNLETCTALLFSNNLLEVPHWFNFMAIESESQQEITNNIKDSNSETQTVQSLNRSVSLNKELMGGKQLQSFEPEKSSFNNSMPKIDVLHTGKNARILHDQEVTAQREASILTNEIQTNSLSSLNSAQTLSNIHQLKNRQIKKNEIKREITQSQPHTLHVPLLGNDVDVGIIHANSQTFPHALARTLRSIFCMCREESRNKGINNTQKKCVSSAVRVEPKTFFANERTLLQWMNMSVLLATISVSLLSFGTQVGRICGLIMAPVAIFFIAYSYYIYLKRNRALETKEPISYNDKFGPTLLVMCLIISLTSVLLLNIIVGGHKQHFKDIHDYYREDYAHYYQNQQNENHLLTQSNNNQSISNDKYLLR